IVQIEAGAAVVEETQPRRFGRLYLRFERERRGRRAVLREKKRDAAREQEPRRESARADEVRNAERAQSAGSLSARQDEDSAAAEFGYNRPTAMNARIPQFLLALGLASAVHGADAPKTIAPPDSL